MVLAAEINNLSPTQLAAAKEVEVRKIIMAMVENKAIRETEEKVRKETEERIKNLLKLGKLTKEEIVAIFGI
ncbi:MAG: hypothetical protein R3E32_11770 [Chitinophagales bacterium]